MCAYACERGWARKQGEIGREKREKCIPCPHSLHRRQNHIEHLLTGGRNSDFLFYRRGTQIYTHTAIYISSIVLLYSRSWRIRRGTGPCRGWLHYIIIIYIDRYTRAGLYAGNIFRYGRLTFTAPASPPDRPRPTPLSVPDVFMSFAYILYDDDYDIYI